MRHTFTVLLVSGLLVSACGWSNSRLNPSNWFDKSTEIDPVVVDDNASVNPLMAGQTERKGLGIFDRPEAEDRSVLIQNVTELRIDPAASGAIVYAVGLAQRQGAFDAELIPEPRDDDNLSTLTLNFKVTYPKTNTTIGNEATRTVNVAYNLSVDDLAEISTIRVVAAENARESRRR